MTRRRRLLVAVSLVIFVLCAFATLYLESRNREISDARDADDAVNAANSSNQPVSFLPLPGEVYKLCGSTFDAPVKLSDEPSPTPTPIATAPPDALPKAIVVGDVVQITIVIGCSFNNADAIAKMRDDQVQFKPGVSALDFDVDGVMTDELAGRDFYCVQSVSDHVCADGSTTPAQDLKWTWFLRPKSLGRHFIRIEINQRKIVGPRRYVEIAPRWVKQYSVDVREPFAGQAEQWLAVCTTTAGLFPVVTSVQHFLSKQKDGAQGDEAIVKAPHYDEA